MLHDAPLADAVDDLRRGRLDPVAYVERLESRAEAVEPDIESLVPEERRWDRLGEAARNLEERFQSSAERPPLYGVPVGVKDVFHARGLPTRAGSKLPAETLTGQEGDAVGRLRRAGALVLGKTVTTEFAYFEPGPTRNPHDPEHTPGGSSSGSAAAVAAGLCPLALGTQTVGSVIRPAAFCGVVGFKPSYDRIPSDGVVSFSPSVDHVGFFTQDVEGATLAAAHLCDDWRSLPTPRGRPTVGVPEGPYLEQASDVGLDAFEEQVAQLRTAGYDVERVSVFENIAEINERHERLNAAEMAIGHEAWYGEYADRYAETTRELIEEGRDVAAAEIARGREGRRELRATLETRMGESGIDLWVAPAARGPAPRGIDSTGDPVMNLPWTHAGVPTAALPAAETDAGLPLGVQCSAPFGADEDLLAWSRQLADVLG
ncbi:Asp-tRNAAsn/Glu-tRNAGln amidotransferase A subunit [Halopelagius inordinatus]|uniref:Asp-tRNAAsn/Glu-tRNAGln amidotransferase A subunit n=1 Tax=Halopelagius inordinatus TaxID=553467 RepID=A0A1I2VBK7_9EURY|nr:amidase [Halopelagius inordinatus]SFG86540.1 Asp-tRNAAsn/Glu-tRNAGln amidotransferase A subunit [Halopelagius inordinatus]